MLSIFNVKREEVYEAKQIQEKYSKINKKLTEIASTAKMVESG